MHGYRRQGFGSLRMGVERSCTARAGYIFSQQDIKHSVIRGMTSDFLHNIEVLSFAVSALYVL